MGILLAAAGLDGVGDDERRRLAELYPGLRRTADRFYDVDAGDEVMAAVYRADDAPAETGAGRLGGEGARR